MSRTQDDPPPVGLKSLALPSEHGGWGMVVEPLLLGLLVAPSRGGAGVALAGLFAFLARHPLKLALADRLQGRRTPRTAAAEGVAAAYGAVALGGLALAARGTGPWWIPLAAAAPLAAVQFVHDVRLRGRQVLPELLGSVALTSLAAAVLMAGGWAPRIAVAAWGLLAAKGASAVLYVRARLRLDRGQPAGRATAIAGHVAGTLGAAALAAGALAPRLAVAAFALLLARAAFGLSPWHRAVRPQVVGLTEMAWGFAFVLALALGYGLGL